MSKGPKGIIRDVSPNAIVISPAANGKLCSDHMTITNNENGGCR